MALNCSFPKSGRLRKRADYLAVQRGGKTLHTRYFVVVTANYRAADESSASATAALNKTSSVGRAKTGAQERKSGRLGITVSKKVGNAVARNRVKRVVREFVRGAGRCAAPGNAQASVALRPWVPANTDVVVIAKKSTASASTKTLWAALESCRGQLQQESGSC